MRKWRKMTWVLLVWTAVFAVWIIGGASAADCGSEATQLNQDACAAGTGIGVALVFVLWFVGFIALSLVWFMTRPRGRDCPACGETAKKGQTQCRSCGFDFAAAAQQR